MEPPIDRLLKQVLLPLDALKWDRFRPEIKHFLTRTDKPDHTLADEFNLMSSLGGMLNLKERHISMFINLVLVALNQRRAYLTDFSLEETLLYMDLFREFMPLFYLLISSQTKIHALNDVALFTVQDSKSIQIPKDRRDHIGLGTLLGYECARDIEKDLPTHVFDVSVSGVSIYSFGCAGEPQPDLVKSFLARSDRYQTALRSVGLPVTVKCSVTPNH